MAASSSTTITVSGHNAQWEWEGDKSIWQQYPINIQQEISQAFDAGNKEVNNKLNFSFNRKIIVFLRLMLMLQMK